MKLGLIGEVLGHSLSPAIHRHLLGAAGIGGTYELIEIPGRRRPGAYRSCWLQWTASM